MDKRIVALLSIYIALWIAIAAGVIYGFVSAGYPWWAALIPVYFLLLISTGSLAYLGRSRRDRLEGREPPPYLMFVFFPGKFKINPQAVEKYPFYKREQPRFFAVLVGIAAIVAGALFLIPGIWVLYLSVISHARDLDVVMVIIGMAIALVGASMCYVGYRLITSKGKIPNDAA